MEIIKKKYVCLPPLVRSQFENYYPYTAYLALVCEIPYGQIATITSIADTLAEVYEAEGLHLERLITHIEDKLRGVYPYWRVVSERGHLLESAGKSTQQEYLEQEGHIIVQPNPDYDAYIVKDYQDKIFDFSNLHFTIATDPIEYDEGYEQFFKKKYEENIKAYDDFLMNRK